MRVLFDLPLSEPHRVEAVDDDSKLVSAIGYTYEDDIANTPRFTRRRENKSASRNNKSALEEVEYRDRPGDLSIVTDYREPEDPPERVEADEAKTERPKNKIRRKSSVLSVDYQ